MLRSHEEGGREGVKAQHVQFSDLKMIEESFYLLFFLIPIPKSELFEL
jgi:hypothetical protein